ncbi:bromodomain containing 1 [Xylariales sp. AK1849]|nr:bromodomain containing 1 [Xylariales sp. AK1849]
MAPSPRTPRQAATNVRRGRQKGSLPSTNSRRRERDAAATATEPPPKRRRYIPGGPGGGGRFLDKDGNEIPGGRPGSATIGTRPRARHSLPNAGASPVYPRRERSTRIRTTTARAEPDDEMQISSAAAVAAAVVQSEGYKPREERGWEEFHPNLDIDGTFMVFHAEDVDGTAKSVPGTPAGYNLGAEHNDAASPVNGPNGASGSAANTPTAAASTAITLALGILPGTPTRRRSNRPRDSYFPYRGDFGGTPKTPKVLPIHNQTPKERLDLKQPSYRKTDRILLFESKTFGQARYVDKAMMNVGYQESDNYIRPDRRLIKATDGNIDDEADHATASKSDGESSSHGHILGRVEYDMDEQDDMWLEAYNTQRKSVGWNPVTREVFEITITKIEKEWHALEKRIPKPNPKPPQTHRPRSSSAAAVNGEPQAGEEQDSKCAICDDGDCENTNAIVFCDGCDLAVHQECYGVPFIPEGQWLCRKCQLIGRGIPTCIFCPNSDGAFKQTNSSKWAHLLCAMWIPEVTLGNHTFMEPVMDVDKVPKSRWKLTCYICNQQMGACIQCGNKACYQAFHVTCARRAKLFLRMKNSAGALDVLDGSTNLKALCDKHCPSEYAKENDVVRATKKAKKYYRKTMTDRIWADSQASAMALAATHRHALTEHPPDESQMTGAKLSAVMGDQKKGQAGKSIWKLPSGAPVIPQAVFDIVELSLQRFNFLKRREFVSDACRYWTLKREMRRGAALLKRLQLQMETFSSMELTRRNFAAMGPSGKARLTRRIEFAETLIKDLEQLQAMSQQVVERERHKLEAAEVEQDFVDTCYFPVHKTLPPIMEKALMLDKNLFQEGLLRLQSKMEERFYTTTLAFAHDLCEVIKFGINSEPKPQLQDQPKFETVVVPPSRTDFSDHRDRKKLGKRILKSIQAQLESALRLEADITYKPFDNLKQELEGMVEASSELRPNTAGAADAAALDAEQSLDVIMVDSSNAEITVAEPVDDEAAADDEQEQVDVVMGEEEGEKAQDESNIEVDTSELEDAKAGAVPLASGSVAERAQETQEKPDEDVKNGDEPLDTPPATNGYVAAPQTSQPGPPTPPQSNGSLGQEHTNILVNGGIPWYLRSFEPEGTSVVLQQWPGKDVMRSLSEELTEMEEDELKGLGADINEGSNTTTSAISTNTAEAGVAAFTSPAKKTTKAKKRKASYRRR